MIWWQDKGYRQKRYPKGRNNLRQIAMQLPFACYLAEIAVPFENAGVEKEPFVVALKFFPHLESMEPGKIQKYFI